jgi:hypothetical protein
MSKIKFIAFNKEVFDDFDPPQPSSKVSPSWYKEMPAFYNYNQTEDQRKIGSNGNPNLTLKRCVPFRDAMHCGYMLTTPFDCYFTKNNNKILINQSYEGEFVLVHEHTIEQYFMYPIPEGYEIALLKWNNPWIIQTQKGWSTMFVSPMHHDLPFYTLSGLVDTDKHPAPIAFPFFIKKNFSGFIPKGTPYVQCIPIKREKNTAYISHKIDSLYYKWRKATTQALDRYKDYFHTPKQYKIVNNQTESKCPFSKFFK